MPSPLLSLGSGGDGEHQHQCWGLFSSYLLVVGYVWYYKAGLVAINAVGHIGVNTQRLWRAWCCVGSVGDASGGAVSTAIVVIGIIAVVVVAGAEVPSQG